MTDGRRGANQVLRIDRIERKIGCLSVVETGRGVGILTEAEIVQSICDG